MGAKIKTFCFYKNKIEYFKNIRERKKKDSTKCYEIRCS